MLNGTQVHLRGVGVPVPPYQGITYVVPCGAKKLDRPAPAVEMYVGSMFRHTYDNAVRSGRKDEAAGCGPARVLILSARYGLITPDQVIDPYDVKMGADGSVSAEMLTWQAWTLGIDWGASVHAMLPRAYFAQLDRALRPLDVYAQDVYEGCIGIGEQRRVNASVGRPEGRSAQLPEKPGPTVWMGTGTYGFWWGDKILVSYGRLREMATLPVAVDEWVLDSRGFNEIADHGHWTITAEEYARDVIRYVTEIGNLTWVACQDWPAAQHLLDRTGLTEYEHQRRTVDSVRVLRRLLDDTDVYVLPVLTGTTLAGYLRHVRMYRDAGIDVTSELVGVGALVKRGPKEVAAIVEALWSVGVRRMHGFGMKTRVLDLVGHRFESVDSADWSGTARREARKTGDGSCPHGLVEWETNCPVAAREWCDEQRGRALAAGAHEQLSIMDEVVVSLWHDEVA